MIDAAWFKRKQKEAGITAQEIAEAAGRHRSQVSHILTGRQAMNLHWAKAFSTALQVPLAEVLRHAGTLEDASETEPGAPVPSGFSEGDASPFAGQAGEREREAERARLFGGGGAGIDVWTVRSTALELDGYLIGDRILVDTNAADRARAGDVVIAQAFDVQRGAADTLLRRYEPPVLVSRAPDRSTRRAHVVDGSTVMIRGKVIASWRT